MAIRYKVRDILRILREDGWILLRTKGSHQQFAHPDKRGLVTVSFHSSNEDLHPKTAVSIFRQAGLNAKDLTK
jgi:predicted RNA binding protein YcfA (HicA-like mRNA interferase family)